MVLPDQGNSARPEMLPPFAFCVQSGKMAAREALGRLLDSLGPLELDIEEASVVELVMAEALNNIVEHAYPIEDDGGPIKIECIHKQDGLHLQIKDCGVAMPDGQLPLGMAVDVNVDLLEMPEGGFGWFLIRDLAKDVQYDRVGRENQLRLRLAVGLPS